MLDTMPKKWVDAMRVHVPSIAEKIVFIFNKDGTLTHALSERICPNDPADVYVLPDVRQCLGGLRAAGAKLAIVTNQGGVAHGIFNEMTAWHVLLDRKSVV